MRSRSLCVMRSQDRADRSFHQGIRKLDGAARLWRRDVVTSVTVDRHNVLFLVDPSKLRGQRVYLLTIDGDRDPAKRDLFATHEAGLRKLKPDLSPVIVR